MAILVSFGVFATGCKKNGNDDPNADRRLRYRDYIGTHDYTSPDVETEDYLIKDGKTDYVIIAPSSPDEFEKRAKNEFLTIFKMATGITVSTKSDADVIPEGTKFISIGKTEQYKALNVTTEELNKLTADGGRIRTIDKNIYIYGGDTGYWQKNNGVVNIVYTFMEICFNWQYYNRTTFTIDKGITEFKLKNFDVWDIPDISGRPNHGSNQTYNLRSYEASAGLTQYDVEYKTQLARLREEDAGLGMSSYTTFGDYTSASAHMHNTSELVSPKSEGVDPKWFSDAGDQLCYTAHGDAESYQKLVEYIAKKFVMSMKYFNPTDYPTRHYLGIMQEDNTMYCNCASCVAHAAANNNAISGAMIKLCNETITLVRSWQDDPNHEVYPYRRDNLKVVFFAYHSSVTPPAKWDEDQQKYVATSPEVQPNEHVVGWVCFHWSKLNDIYNPATDNRRKQYDAWGDLLKETWHWLYTGDYQFDPYFLGSDNNLNENVFKWMASQNSTWSFDNISAGGTNPTAFRDLQLYKHSKLSWNSSLSAKEITENYFDAAFDVASDEIKEIYNLYIDHDNLLQLHPSWAGGFNRAMFWSYNGFLKPVAEKFEAALDKVDSVYANTDPAYGELVKSRINQEYLATLYKILAIYGKDSANAPFVESVRQDYKQKFRDIVTKYFPEHNLNGQGSALDFINGLA